MTGTHSIYIQTFHGHYVLQHFFLTDRSACLLTEIMPVHTVEDYPFAVN